MRIALDLLAKGGDPEHRTLRTPVTAQNGALYIGPVKIAALPAVAWQGRD
jgi:hypothetical protein